jgi:hypothetical protein
MTQPATPAAPQAPQAPQAPEPLIARRSPLPFLVLGAATIVALAGNVWGGLNFPYNAPVEQIMCFGFVIDMVALLILSVIGVVVARQPIGVKASSALAPVGLALTAISLGLVILGAWVPQLVLLGTGVPLHYSSETGPAFFLAPAWITGLAFCGFSYRRGGARRNNLFSLIGLGLGIAVFVLAAFSAVIYGLDLTT